MILEFLKFQILCIKYYGVCKLASGGYIAQYKGKHIAHNADEKMCASFVNFAAVKMGHEKPNKGMKCIDPKSIKRKLVLRRQSEVRSSQSKTSKVI